MAELSSQDVVNNVQSTDAAASVDASASTTQASAALEASSQTHTSSRSVSPPLQDKLQKGEALMLNSSHAGEEGTDGDLASGHGSGGRTGIDMLAASALDSTSELMSKSNGSSNEHGITSEGETAVEGGDSQPKSGDLTPRNAVKNRSTFKAVSVTKSFLAKAGTPPAQLSRTGSDSAMSSTNSTGASAANSLRPRLVSKPATGHKLSLSTQVRDGTKIGQSSGPDPMQVWNKNRVQTPQATPKHLTNEELREQYGIQLAAIPVGDGDDKGNKWADIDDEEDDWAPEVIEWADGSKVNLAEAEKKEAAEKEKAAQEARQREQTARAMPAAGNAIYASPRGAKAPSAAGGFAGPEMPENQTSLGPKATVFKVGGSLQAKSLNIEPQNIVKVTEKPTLVAKPVAPAPVKSPWATLPPVDKVPPVPIHPPPPTANSNFPRPQGDMQAHDRGPAPWRQAREMEADDFSRMPRDSPTPIPRELFNSHSGRYEPVVEGRRGSFKRDQGFRGSAVLQRPGPDQEVPITMLLRRGSEAPSAGFESEEGSVSKRSYNDGKSDVTTAQPWRRQQGSWMQSHIRSGSQTSNELGQNSVTASDGPNEASPSIQPAILEGQMHTQEDAVAVQKRLMREKREAAIKRRQEEEAKEEAERKERIRKKLESMGPPPEKKDKEKLGSVSPVAANGALRPAIIGNVDSKATADHGDLIRSPPKPPVPTAQGEPQQYGMMKVHPSPLPNGHAGAVRPQTTTSGAATGLVDTQGKFAPKSSASSNITGSLPDHEQQTQARPGPEPSHSGTYPQDKNRWTNNIVNVSKTWERPSEVQNMLPNSELWAAGPPRNLGNGDFNSLHPQPRAQFRQPHISSESILPSPHVATSASVNNGPSSGANNAVKSDSFVQGQSPFGPEATFVGGQPQPPSIQSRTPGTPSPLVQSQASQQRVPPNHFSSLPEPRTGVDAWANFATNIGEHDAAARARLMQERNRQAAELQARGRTPLSQHYNETWEQVGRGEDLGARQIIATQITTRSQSQPQDRLPNVGEEITRQPAVTMPPQHPRASRFHNFFGHHEQVVPPLVQYAAQSNRANRPLSPTVPPPESYEHPAYDSNTYRPRVRLPGQGIGRTLAERPVVRLPPVKSLPQHPVVAQLRGMPPPLRGPAQPLAKTLTWQHRFDGLFNKSPEQRAAEPVGFSSSKAQFDIMLSNDYAAVNFPQPGQISPISPRSVMVVSSQRSIDEEEALFDGEQGPGSTPPVRFPPNKYPPGWSAAASPTGKRSQLGDQDILSRFIWIVGLEDFQAKKVTVTVRLHGMKEAKKRDLTSGNIQNPRMFGKNSAHQKAKAPIKAGRKSRDASSQPPPAHAAKRNHNGQSSLTVPATVTPQHAAPATWAKRVSAGI